ncbi:unnamed protein product, partial [Meganyctiphanes norvegica]
LSRFKMATGLHLEHYLDSLENLPTELQRNFHMMRDLDQRAQDVMRNIDQISEDFLLIFFQLKDIALSKKPQKVQKLDQLFDRLIQFDKINRPIYEADLVDKHIRRLDSDLAKFEAEIKEKALNNTKKEEETSTKKKGRKKKGEEKGSKKRKGAESDEETTPTKAGGRKQKKKKIETESVIASVIGLSSVAHPSDVLDMPVDPNEPTYCLCHQVSYGEMIACDKPDCPIEWFHFACVGLTTKPKGKWYCPKCSTERKKKR